jgi:5-bromo-4-chloroindolyl phosphate hydrolysis protein.
MFTSKKSKMNESLNINVEKLRDLQRDMRKLREMYGKVRNYNIASNLKNVCILNDKIFKEVSLNQDKLEKVSTFMNYYIPTLIKILQQYVYIKENEMKDTLSENTIVSIEKAICDVELAFNKILSRLYKDDNQDIYAELKVLLSELGSIEE